MADVYWLDRDAVVIADVFAKKMQRTPATVIARCQKCFHQYDQDRSYP
jgi:hypothetical protein